MLIVFEIIFFKFNRFCSSQFLQLYYSLHHRNNFIKFFDLSARPYRMSNKTSNMFYPSCHKTVLRINPRTGLSHHLMNNIISIVDFVTFHRDSKHVFHKNDNIDFMFYEFENSVRGKYTFTKPRTKQIFESSVEAVSIQSIRDSLI